MAHQNTLMTVRTNVLRAIAFAWENKDDLENGKFYGKVGLDYMLSKAKASPIGLTSLENMESVNIQFMKPKDTLKYNPGSEGYSKDWIKEPNQEIITICLPSCPTKQNGDTFTPLEKASALMKYYELSPHFFHESSFANNNSISVVPKLALNVNTGLSALNFFPGTHHALLEKEQILRGLQAIKFANIEQFEKDINYGNEIINALQAEENREKLATIQKELARNRNKDKLGLSEDGFLSFGSIVLQIIAESWKNKDFQNKYDFDMHQNEIEKYDNEVNTLLTKEFQFESLWDMKIRFVFTKEGEFKDSIDRSSFGLSNDRARINGVRTLIEVVLPPCPDNDDDILPALAAYNCIGPRYPFTCS